jgi:hypothetical protein
MFDIKIVAQLNWRWCIMQSGEVTHLGFALSTIGLAEPSYEACYLLVAGFFVFGQALHVKRMLPKERFQTTPDKHPGLCREIKCLNTSNRSQH